ncbi:Holliday junction branch migration protein RuvA [Candidatus Endowatersipora endosymbiont of Watersipora subatra]|uniref:Holliday junction branch migration protein RuvA n=1 Tax=Candidatus Endowatersipora endosymbiont of Watersipora subatra TaxID=3077946 RepID=UPI00312C6DEE
MIGKLKGVIDTLGKNSIILDVQGVGYLVNCSLRTVSCLPQSGNVVVLSIETHVRETEIKLFGFLDDRERDWFRLLQNVQGVGAKLALAILGTLTPEELDSAISLQNEAIVSRSPGVGLKVAQRIVAELKDKSPRLSGDLSLKINFRKKMNESNTDTTIKDSVSALTHLGYSGQQAVSAISAARMKVGDEIDSPTLIRLSLKELIS